MQETTRVHRQVGYYRWMLFGLLFVGILIAYFSRTMTAFVSYSFIKEFNLNPVEFSLLRSSFWIGYIASAFFSGFLIDRVGIRAILGVAGLGWAAASAANIFADSLDDLFLFRVVLGVTQGAIFPTIARTLNNWSPGMVRTRMAASILSAVPFAAGFGIMLLPIVVDTWDWRTTYGILATLTLFWSVLWLLLAADYPQSNPLVEEGELIYILEGNWPDRSLTAQELRRKELNDYRLRGGILHCLFKSRYLLSNYYVAFVFGYLLFFGAAWLPNYLERAFPGTQADSALGEWILALPWIVGVVSMALFTIFSDQIQRQTNNLFLSRSVLIASGLLIASIFLLFVGMAQSLTVAVVLITFGVGFTVGTNPLSFTMNIDYARGRAASSTGVWDACFSSGGITGLWISNFIAGRTHSYEYTFVIVAALTLSAVITVLLFQRPQKVLA